MSYHDLSISLAMRMILISMTLSGCMGDRYVARLNAECRTLRDYTIVDTDVCVVCAKKGSTVTACAIKGE